MEAEGADYELGPLMEAVNAALAGGVKLAEESIFDDRGVARVAVIRPCVSRGRRIRGLPPFYSQEMLAENAGVFTGWPMYMDHVAPQVAEALRRAGRSMKELGGQVLKSWWDPEFVHEDDDRFGYMKGGVLAEAWGTPFMQQLVGNNPNLLHVSINAYPKSGRPKTVEAHAGKLRAMAIEGIREEPQGSVDYVPRGGAGGRLLPRRKASRSTVSIPGLPGAREREVSSPGLPYASRQMDGIDLSKATPDELREHLREHRPELLAALGETVQQAPAGGAAAGGDKPLTEAEVQQMIAEAQQNFSRTLEQERDRIREEVEQETTVRESQRSLSAKAKALIEDAENIPARWKADLANRYALTPSGPTPALAAIEAEMDGDKVVKSAEDVLKESVDADLKYAAELIAEAAGKPVITGQGSGSGGGDGGEGGGTVTESSSSWAEVLDLSLESEDGKPSEVDLFLREGVSV